MSSDQHHSPDPGQPEGDEPTLGGPLARLRMSEHTFMVVAALFVGALGGLGAVGFRLLIRLLQDLFWGEVPLTLEVISSHPWWWIILAPTVGGLIVGPLVYFFAREAKGHGVPEVMEAVALNSGAIRPRVVVVKSLASALSIASGGSVGREGPIVQIGSALGSTLGQWLKVSGRRLRTLVGCGAAARNGRWDACALQRSRDAAGGEGRPLDSAGKAGRAERPPMRLAAPPLPLKRGPSVIL